MEPGQILLVVAALACPIGMGVMMWLMNKQMSGQAGHSMPSNHAPANSDERLASLRAQRQQLEVEITEVSRLAELETKRDELASAAVAGSLAQNDAGVQSNPGTTH